MDPFYCVASKDHGLTATWDLDEAITAMVEAAEAWLDRKPDVWFCDDKTIMGFDASRPEYACGSADPESFDRVASAANGVVDQVDPLWVKQYAYRLMHLAMSRSPMVAALRELMGGDGCVQAISLDDLSGFDPDAELRRLRPSGYGDDTSIEL